MIQQNHKIVQTVLHSALGCLPHLTFLDLAIAQNGVYPVVLVQVFGCHSQTACHADALSQRSGVHINARRLVAVGMALQVAVQLAQGPQILPGEETQICQNGVLCRAAVTLAQHNAVTILPLGVLGVHMGSVIVDSHEHLHQRQ